MKIEVRIKTSPFTAIILVSALRPRSETPSVSDRTIGVLPIGFTIGNKAPTTRRVFFTRSARVPFNHRPIYSKSSGSPARSGRAGCGEIVTCPAFTASALAFISMVLNEVGRAKDLVAGTGGSRISRAAFPYRTHMVKTTRNSALPLNMRE